MSAWQSWADEAQDAVGSWPNRYWLAHRRSEQLTDLLGEQAFKVSVLMDAVEVLQQQLAAARAENAELSEQLEASESEREALEAAQWPAQMSA